MSHCLVYPKFLHFSFFIPFSHEFHDLIAYANPLPLGYIPASPVCPIGKLHLFKNAASILAVKNPSFQAQETIRQIWQHDHMCSISKTPQWKNM